MRLRGNGLTSARMRIAEWLGVRTSRAEIRQLQEAVAAWREAKEAVAAWREAGQRAEGPLFGTMFRRANGRC